MQKKSFQIFQKEFFSNSTSFLLKKSYIPSNIAPFNYPGTLRVIGPGSGPGPGNGKSQKTGSGPGTPLLGISGYPGNSLPVATLQCIRCDFFYYSTMFSYQQLPTSATIQKSFSDFVYFLFLNWADLTGQKNSQIKSYKYLTFLLHS